MWHLLKQILGATSEICNEYIGTASNKIIPAIIHSIYNIFYYTLLVRNVEYLLHSYWNISQEIGSHIGWPIASVLLVIGVRKVVVCVLLS